MTRDSAGFFARLFGKRTVVGEPVEPGTSDAHSTEEKSSPPAAADSPHVDLATTQRDDDARTGEHVENTAQESSDAGQGATQDAEVTPTLENADPEDAGPIRVDPETVALSGQIPRQLPKSKVVTVLSLVPDAGLATLCAALEHRYEDQGLTIRAAGPGLMRAAFAGALSESDALVMVAPADPEVTAEFAEKLSWLEANGRTKLVGRSIFVVNYGVVKGDQALQLPADLPRPVVVLPFDNALSLPTSVQRAPRRAARHALSQIVEELNIILELT
ncbi:hypothetical protein CQ018_16585 [Arthrobacter sp. MYb227]|uniref:hypothetical protein n=1 Tax=Arthrobacter sp. MYb227 TaxID=1848601 RepID=UPI000CFB2E90|nr:hypothetical protein [Arthrobacter sp. MYb227]PQZ88609.1 hypothetical protein CQ018_16585 [Arthrobacter sp. MYb227]